MAKSESSLAGIHCLVLDDEYLIALDIQHILETAGATSVTCVASIEGARAALSDGRRLDLAVLDLKLGDAGDSTAIAAVLAVRNTPIIFLTGASGDDILLRAFASAPVVEKPYQAPLLLAAVMRALAK